MSSSGDDGKGNAGKQTSDTCDDDEVDLFALAIAAQRAGTVNYDEPFEVSPDIVALHKAFKEHKDSVCRIDGVLNMTMCFGKVTIELKHESFKESVMKFIREHASALQHAEYSVLMTGCTAALRSLGWNPN